MSGCFRGRFTSRSGGLSGAGPPRREPRERVDDGFFDVDSGIARYLLVRCFAALPTRSPTRAVVSSKRSRIHDGFSARTIGAGPSPAFLAVRLLISASGDAGYRATPGTRDAIACARLSASPLASASPGHRRPRPALKAKASTPAVRLDDSPIDAVNGGSNVRLAERRRSRPPASLASRRLRLIEVNVGAGAESISTSTPGKRAAGRYEPGG